MRNSLKISRLRAEITSRKGGRKIVYIHADDECMDVNDVYMDGNDENMDGNDENMDENDENMDVNVVPLDAIDICMDVNGIPLNVNGAFMGENDVSLKGDGVPLDEHEVLLDVNGARLSGNVVPSRSVGASVPTLCTLWPEREARSAAIDFSGARGRMPQSLLDRASRAAAAKPRDSQPSGCPQSEGAGGGD